MQKHAHEDCDADSFRQSSASKKSKTPPPPTRRLEFAHDILPTCRAKVVNIPHQGALAGPSAFSTSGGSTRSMMLVARVSVMPLSPIDTTSINLLSVHSTLSTSSNPQSSKMVSLAFLLSTLSCCRRAAGREITFPPAVGSVGDQNLLGLTPGLPGNMNPFAGLTTFANLPFVQCLKDAENDAVEPFDIAFLGAPFDTVSWVLR
jgi:hypothetical protein